MQRQCAYVGWGLQPGGLAVVTLPPCSTAPTVAGCCLVGCSVVNGRPLCSRAVAGLSRHVCVCLGPVLASHAPSPLAAAAFRMAWAGSGSHSGVELWRIRGRKKGVVCGVGQEKLGPSYFFISLVLGPLNSLLWYVPSSRYIWSSAPIFCFCKKK